MYKNVIIIAILVMMFVISGCTTETTGKTTQNLQANSEMSCADNTCGMSSAKVEVEKIEIYHFHGNNQCASCIAVGKLAEETANTYYSEELKSGKIVFAHINAELPENVELAKKYGVTGSSLWIGVYTKDGKFKAEQNTNVWYKINDKEDYMTYLKGVVDKRLEGDFS